MLRLSGRAISLGDGWIIEVPSRRLRVRVRTLRDTDERVTSALHLRSTAQWPPRARVELTEFLTLEDCPAAKRRELIRAAGQPMAGSRAS